MSLLLETCVVSVLGSTYKVNVIDSHCLVCYVELSATPMGQAVAFAMIFGAPSKFTDLNQFVSAEYHLLQMIFSRDCSLQNNYFHKIHQFFPPGTALVSPRADHDQANASVPGISMGMPLPAQLRGGLRQTSCWGREKFSKPRLPGGIWDPISAVTFLGRELTPSHTTQAHCWSWVMDPEFLLNLEPTGFLGLSLYICFIFTLVLSNLTQFPLSCIYSL